MNLDNLSQSELRELIGKLQSLEEAGQTLANYGFDAFFDLTPGCDVIMHVAMTMPGLEADAPAPQTFDPDKLARAVGLVYDGADEALNASSGHVDGQPIEAWSPPVGEYPPLPAFLQPQSPSPAEAEPTHPELERDVSEASPEPAGEGTGAARECAAPVPVSNAWTADEDTLLVETVAWQMFDAGLSRHAAAEIAAGVLKRPVPGTQFRAKAVLRDRIEARLAERKAGNNVEVMTAIPAGPPANPVQDAASAVADESRASEGPEDAEGMHPKPVDASEPAVAGAGSPLTPTGELHAHLAKVKRDKLWTLERDHDLMHFSLLQWPAGDIAPEIKVPVAEIKPRFAVLTASRKFKAADVLAALAAQLGTKAA